MYTIYVNIHKKCFIVTVFPLGYQSVTMEAVLKEYIYTFIHVYLYELNISRFSGSC